jgi:putative transcriptional regulator
LIVVVAAACLGTLASREVGSQEPPGAVGRGELLVATEELRDPRFFHAVIYLLKHDETGTIGLVVNHPVAEMPMADLLRSVGVHRPGTAGQVRVHSGGPVDPARGFVLHSTDYKGPDNQVVKDGLAFSVHPAILTAIADGRGPRRWLFFLGYAGWAPGQLEAEIQRGDWITVEPDQALLFDEPAERKWDRAIARRRFVL